jgi:protein-tyrosine phosphatase
MSQSTLDQLARGVNLRDLGGHQTRDGRELRRGLLYRSASLCELSTAQLAIMRTLKIRSIVDLRHNGERAVHPTPWRDLGCSYYWFHDHEPPPGDDLNTLLADKNLTAAAARDLMIRAYRAMPYWQVEGLRGLFRTVATEEGAFLFHCTSGKDRTGIGAALALSALEVPRDAILTDYLETLKFDVLASPAYQQGESLSTEWLEALRPIYTVEREYLDAMFDAIVERDGSVEAFLYQTVGLDAAVLNAFRNRLLT